MFSLGAEVRKSLENSAEDDLMWNAGNCGFQLSAAMVQDCRSLRNPDHASGVRPFYPSYCRHQITALMSLLGKLESYAN